MSVGNTLMGLPAVVVFGLLSYMIVRSRRVSWIDVWIFVLFGFYLGGTGLAKFINALVVTIPNMIGGVKS
jgi:hypothetical protein